MASQGLTYDPALVAAEERYQSRQSFLEQQRKQRNKTIRDRRKERQAKSIESAEETANITAVDAGAEPTETTETTETTKKPKTKKGKGRKAEQVYTGSLTESEDSGETLSNTVETLSKAVKDNAPIVIGGAILASLAAFLFRGR